MDITKNNFHKKFKYIQEAISTADFIAIDMELTGINPNIKKPLDSIEERYDKYRRVGEKFQIMQFGLCTFELDTSRNRNDSETYLCKPFNIYLFPDDSNSCITMEVGGIVFNREHGFNFNKWINEGVSYVNTKKAESIKNSYIEHNYNVITPSSPIYLYREDDRQKYEEFIKRFELFMHDEKQLEFIYEKLHRTVMSYFLSKLKTSVRNSIFIIEDFDEKKQLMKITKVSSKERERLMNSYFQTEVNELVDSRKGAKRILDELQKYKSRILGHNCILDFIFLLSHFDELPRDSKGFKRHLGSMFREIYDTKYMFNRFMRNRNTTAQHSNLEKMYKCFKDSNSKISFRITHELDWDSRYTNGIEAFHEAAYDAFVTGCCFSFMSKEMNASELSSVEGRFYLMSSVFDSFYIRGEDSFEFPNAQLYGFKMKHPKTIKNVNFQELFDLLDKEKRLIKIIKDNSLNAVAIITDWTKADKITISSFNQIINKLGITTVTKNDGSTEKQQVFVIYNSYGSFKDALKDSERENPNYENEDT